MKRYWLGTIGAGLLMVYGFCILAAGSGMIFYLAWFFLAAIILLQTYYPALHKRHPDSRVLHCLKQLIHLFWILFFSIVTVTWLLIFSCFHDAGKPDLDYLIVLGSQVKEDGPSLVTRDRLDAAYAYLIDNPDTLCIVTGGQGWNEPEAEAVIMKQYLVDRGIESDRIIEEDQSKNTVENIENSRQIILSIEGNQESQTIASSCGIVTSNFHLYRGKHLAMHAGFQNVSGIAAKTPVFYLPNNMLRETCGILKDFVCGNLS